MAHFKFKDEDGNWNYGSGGEVPLGAHEMSETLWRKERDLLIRSTNVSLLETVTAMRPVSLFAARKVLRDTKASDGESYMKKVEKAYAAGDLSEDAFEAIQNLDPVSRSSPWIAEFQQLFGMTDEQVDLLFSKMRAVQV